MCASYSWRANSSVAGDSVSGGKPEMALAFAQTVWAAAVMVATLAPGSAAGRAKWSSNWIACKVG